MSLTEVVREPAGNLYGWFLFLITMIRELTLPSEPLSEQQGVIL